MSEQQMPGSLCPHHSQQQNHEQNGYDGQDPPGKAELALASANRFLVACLHMVPHQEAIPSHSVVH